MTITLKSALHAVAAFSGMLAAFFWYKSTVVKVAVNDNVNADGMISASVSMGDADVVLTAREQNRQNRKAATCAAIAAFAQSISLMVPE